MTTVSIPLALYNGSKFLGQQRQILAPQERLPDEFVVSDDASIDGTVAKIEAICRDSAISGWAAPQCRVSRI